VPRAACSSEELEVVAQVRAAEDAAAAALARAEDVAEDVAERLGEAAEAGGIRTHAAHLRVHAGVAVESYARRLSASERTS
jgi:hypothetical protein